MKKNLEWLLVKVFKQSTEDAMYAVENYSEKHKMQKIAFWIALPTSLVMLVFALFLLVSLLLAFCGVISLDGFDTIASVIGWSVMGVFAIVIALEMIGRKMKATN